MYIFIFKLFLLWKPCLHGLWIKTVFKEVYFEKFTLKILFQIYILFYTMLSVVKCCWENIDLLKKLKNS